jgi:hypothetical protein
LERRCDAPAPRARLGHGLLEKLDKTLIALVRRREAQIKGSIDTQPIRFNYFAGDRWLPVGTKARIHEQAPELHALARIRSSNNKEKSFNHSVCPSPWRLNWVATVLCSLILTLAITLLAAIVQPRNESRQGVSHERRVLVNAQLDAHP